MNLIDHYAMAQPKKVITCLITNMFGVWINMDTSKKL